MSSKNDEMDVVFKQSEKTQSEASCRGNVFLSLTSTTTSRSRKKIRTSSTHTHTLTKTLNLTLKHTNSNRMATKESVQERLEKKMVRTSRTRTFLLQEKGGFSGKQAQRSDDVDG